MFGAVGGGVRCSDILLKVWRAFVEVVCSSELDLDDDEGPNT